MLALCRPLRLPLTWCLRLAVHHAGSPFRRRATLPSAVPGRNWARLGKRKGTVTAIANAVMAAAIVSFVMCLVICFSVVILSRRAVVSGDVIMKISFSAASVDRSLLNPIIQIRKIYRLRVWHAAISMPGRDNRSKRDK